VDMEYVSKTAITTLLNKLVNSAKNLEETLRNVFNKIDSNNNGFVEKNEIANLSKELGHELSQSECDEISHVLAGDDGKITYEKFKSWWITGRTNFPEFRKLVEIEMSVGKLLKQGSSQFNSYFEKIQKEIAESSQVGDCQYKARVAIGPQEEFSNGVGLSVHVAVGNEFQSIASTLPDYITHSPICYSIEIGIKDPEQGPMIVAKLSELKEMFGEMIPPLKQAIQMGLEIHFRNVANSIFVDLVVSGVLGGQIQAGFGMFDIGNTMFSGSSNFHVSSGFIPTTLVSETLEKVIFDACHLRIEGSGEFSQVKALLNAVTNMMSLQQLPPKMKPIISAIKVLSCLRRYEFDLKYSSKDLLELVKEGISAFKHHSEGETGFQKVSSEFVQHQQMMQMMIEQGKGFAMFIADYMDIIKNINFDSFSLNFSLSKFKVFYKLALHIPGVTNFLNENILN